MRVVSIFLVSAFLIVGASANAFIYTVTRDRDDLVRILKETCGSTRYILQNAMVNNLHKPYNAFKGRKLLIFCFAPPTCSLSDVNCDPSGTKCYNGHSGITYKLLQDTGIGDCGGIISTMLDKTKCQCADACSKSSECVAARIKTNGICQLCRGYYVPIKYPGYLTMAKSVHHKPSYTLDDPVLDEQEAVELAYDELVVEESLLDQPVVDEEEALVVSEVSVTL